MVTRACLADFAARKGIIIGACHAEPLEAGAAWHAPFVSSNEKKRKDPRAILPDCESIIIVGVQSGSLLECDYHVIVREILQELAAELSLGKHKILVDSSTLDERAFAHRAGLGFYGKSGLIISEKFGSRFNLGLLLTTEKAEPTPPVQGHCNTCNACVAACPGRTLPAPIDHTRCISYLTQKETLTPAEEKIIANAGKIYGCGICQEVCPYNSPTPAPAIDWQNIQKTAAGWRGEAILRRNERLVSTR
jgi:epoxyqueuosine reductase